MNSRIDAAVYGVAPLASRGEFADRVRRLRDEMEQAGLDAVVLTSRDNYEYFSSHRTTDWSYHARPVFLVIGRSSVVIVACEGDAEEVAHGDPESTVRLYKGFLPEAAEAVVSVCASLGAKPATIGVDYGHEHGGRGSLTMIQGLGKLGTVVEAANVIWNVRAIKSEFELGLLRATFDIANRAFDETLRSAQVGVTEADLNKTLQVELVKNGADRVDPCSLLFGKTGFLYGRPSSNRQLQKDDYIWTDFRSSYGGYPADRNRTARVGTPSLAERGFYAAVRQVTIELGEGIRPGSTCADAYQLFVSLWNGAGLPETSSVHGAGRVGHGGGMGLTEPPSIAAHSTELIKPGMVLHLEPKLETKFGVYQCEEVVHIGEERNEFICAVSPEELTVIEP